MGIWEGVWMFLVCPYRNLYEGALIEFLKRKYCKLRTLLKLTVTITKIKYSTNTSNERGTNTVKPVLNRISTVQKIFLLKSGFRLIKVYYDNHRTWKYFRLRTKFRLIKGPFKTGFTLLDHYTKQKLTKIITKIRAIFKAFERKYCFYVNTADLFMWVNYLQYSSLAENCYVDFVQWYIGRWDSDVIHWVAH
jgi:hypothetical protein